MKFGIVGAGLIGARRAKWLTEMGHKIEFVVDPEENGYHLAKQYDVSWYSYLEHNAGVYTLLDVDALIIATPHQYLFENAYFGIDNRKHVLIEKPGAISSHEMKRLIQLRDKMDVHVEIGYNHPFHTAFLDAEALLNTGRIGDLYFISALYGHGGAHLQKQGWRTDPSNRGDLLDKGCHLIDLTSHFFQEPIEKVNGIIKSYHNSFGIEDNTFMTLESVGGKVAQLQTSCTNWRNTFYFGLFGSRGKIEINGLGGSYGDERMTVSTLVPGQIKPSVYIEEYLGEDTSWKFEMECFISDIEDGKQGFNTLEKGLNTLEVIEEIYRQNEKKAKDDPCS